ncbi:MAG: hypothetical protein U0Y10_14095 [Spirosomataceae bacterium]
MKKIVLTLSLCVATMAAIAQTTPIDTIRTNQVANYLDKKVVLVGKVVNFKESYKEGNKTKRVFINLDQDYPNNAIQVVLFVDATEQTPDLSGYRDKEVALSGVITDYRGKPELKINHLSQLHIISQQP